MESQSPSNEFARKLYEKYIARQRAQRQMANPKDEELLTKQKDFQFGKKSRSESFLSNKFRYAEGRYRGERDYDISHEIGCKELYHSFEAGLADGILRLEEIDGEVYLMREKDVTEIPPVLASYPRLPEKEILEGIGGRGHKKIFVLDTRLPVIFYRETPYGHQRKLRELLSQTDHEFKFLLSNPSGELLQLRLKNLYSGERLIDFKDTAVKRLKYLENLQRDFPDRIEVRIFDELPNFNIFRIDEAFYLGWYPSAAISKENSYIAVEEKKNYFSAQLKKHCAEVWRRSIPLSDSYQKIRDAFQLERRYFEDLKSKEISIFFPKDSFYSAELSDLLSSEADRQADEDFVTFTACFPPEGASSAGMKWRLSGEEFDGLFSPIQENYFRCQINQGDFTLNVVIPSTIRRDNTPVWIIYSIIRSEESFCGTTVAVGGPLNQTVVEVERLKEMAIQQNRNFWNPVSIMQSPTKNMKFLNNLVGVYKVYAYGRKDGKDVMILSNTLEIGPLGRVNFYRYENTVTAKGHFNYDGYNLFIELSILENDQDEGKKCYFSFYINNKVPTAGSMYGGIFLNQSKNHNYPHGRRVVMEYIRRSEAHAVRPERNTLHGAGYQELPEGVKLALKGRVENFIAFPRENNAIYDHTGLLREAEKNRDRCDFGEIFYMAACFEAREGNYRKAATNFRRAYNNGFEDFAKFEQSLADISPEAKSKVTQEKEYTDILELYNNPDRQSN